ncbi:MULTISPECIES: hypothetical protein [Bacillaceae]|nr:MULTISPECIES: hypothetical protein [Bacillaceae]SFD50358.1 hypothetical protein SAMN02799633_03996 [Bacillus sp. UNCCL81]
MENKLTHYDGSGINKEVFEQNFQQEDFQVTEEMRTNISGNPYIFE